MQKKKINTSIYNPDHIGCIMEDMLFAERDKYICENIEDAYIWVISGNIWDKIFRVYQRSIGLCGVSNIVVHADPDRHMSYKIFDIEVEITEYEKDTITLMKKNERRKEMRGTCSYHNNLESMKINTSKIHYNSMSTFRRVPNIKNVIFNDPATIVFWSDGTKTVVKVQDGEPYDAEKGLAMAISKKALGNQGNYCNEFKKWLPEEEVDDSKEIELVYDGAALARECRKAIVSIRKFGSNLSDKKDE